MQTIWEIKSHRLGSGPGPDPTTTVLLSPLTKQLLSLRGIEDDQAIDRYLFPQLDQLHDPYLMKGMREAVSRILRASEKKELIMVHGDYDVDGITGAALLSRMLQKLGAEFYCFLPDRAIDGYGVSKRGIREAKEKNAKLMITVDCGIAAIEQVTLARELGMDVIILDHHQVHAVLPDANVIINPLQADCPYPFKELSACGLAFKLAQALLGPFAHRLLDLAALSSVCDVAPLAGENRIIVKYGLDVLTSRQNVGLAKLAEVGKIRSPKATTTHLGFVYGPRINACGRMSSPETALRLLVTSHEKEAASLARVLDEENKVRQREDREMLRQAVQKVEREINFTRDRVIVLWQEGWHPGVIGIVAQRLAERYGRPSFVIALVNGKGKASARSIKGFHLFKALEACQGELEEFGGHELAAGFSIVKDKCESFRQKMNDYALGFDPKSFVKSITVDLEITFRDLTPSFLRELALFAPFGPGNPKPVLLTRGVCSKKGTLQSKGNTLSWWVTDGAQTFQAAWTQKQAGGEAAPGENETYDIVYSPSLKERDGIATVSLAVKDVKITGTST